MAKGTRKRTKREAVAQTEQASPQIWQPDFVGQSFASCGTVPSRAYIKGGIVGNIGSMRARFNNLYDGIMPFQSQEGYITVKDAIWLCQKAFFNVAIFRNAISTMADLCNTDISLEGGNSQSKSFFNAWLKRINIWKMQDSFFRELFRSGNVFYFRVDGSLTKQEALKINESYSANASIDIPLRYIMLNVADIAATNNVTSYDTPVYYKILTQEQLKQLKNSKTKEDKEVVKSLRQSMKQYFDTGGTQLVPIDTNKLHTIFYQKQDYEPFAIPLGYSVLDDINLKLEFKKTDAVLARTVEYIILLVTMGEKFDPTTGSGGVNPHSIRAMQELFRKEAVGRVLVSDWTTKLDWAIPDLNKVLGPQKYETVNQDIAAGLMDIFFGQQKFANLAGKLKVFVEKLNAAQHIFLNDFLNPEIKRIAGNMAFKSYPTAKMLEVSLDDPTLSMRIFTQLLQLGAITPQDAVEAISTGELPLYEDLVTHQEEFKKLRDEGLFQPIVSQYPPERIAQAQAQFPKPVAGGGTPSTKTAPKPAGRPAGTKAPQTTKKVGPIGTGSEQQFSMAKLIDVIKLSDVVREQVTVEYKLARKKKRLSEADKSFIEQTANSIFENENPDDWEEKITEYVETPLPPNPERVAAIEEIASVFELSQLSATLLYNSKI